MVARRPEATRIEAGRGRRCDAWHVRTDVRAESKKRRGGRTSGARGREQNRGRRGAAPKAPDWKVGKIPMTFSKISGALDPRAINVRLATVGFHTVAVLATRGARAWTTLPRADAERALWRKSAIQQDPPRAGR